jgi:hypothetical protein
MPNEIIPYLEICQREGFSLQSEKSSLSRDKPADTVLLICVFLHLGALKKDSQSGAAGLNVKYPTNSPKLRAQ